MWQTWKVFASSSLHSSRHPQAVFQSGDGHRPIGKRQLWLCWFLLKTQDSMFPAVLPSTSIVATSVGFEKCLFHLYLHGPPRKNIFEVQINLFWYYDYSILLIHTCLPSHWCARTSRLRLHDTQPSHSNHLVRFQEVQMTQEIHPESRPVFEDPSFQLIIVISPSM